MPVVDFATKADFDQVYRIGLPANRKVKLHYNRAVMYERHNRHTAKALVDIFGWPTSTKILIVGAGFGWTAEILETDYGYTNIVTTDTSGWIQTNQDTSEEAEIDAAITAYGLDPASGEGLVLKNSAHIPGNRRRASRPVENEDLSNNGSRNRIRNILGDLEVGITEDVLPSLTDAEILSIADRVDRINAGIARIHLVSVLDVTRSQDQRFNWHTLAEYKTLLPNDTFVSMGDWQVL